jgi:septal ring-binding cell division protein DamX
MVRIITVIFLLIPVGVMDAYADQTQVFNAMAQGDYQRAAAMLQTMANNGDVEAQYNLALLYLKGNGVNPDKNLSNYWLSMAARQGLAPAYARLNSNSVKPTQASIAVKLAVSPEEWVATQNPKYYTLQLASSTNQQLIEKYYQENELEGHAGYYRSKREGEEWYALVYGAYPSVSDAKDAIETLPQDLKKWSPWVRNIKSIHRIMLH